MGLSSADIREIKTVIISTFNDKYLQEIADKLAAKVEKQIEEKLNAQNAIIAALQSKVEKLFDENRELKNLLEVQEQESRNLNVRIFNMPIKENEDIRSEVISVLKNTFKTNINSTDIQKCHRITSKNPSDHPAAVLVRFTSDSVRSTVLKSRKLVKTSINIKEDLTKHRLKLFKSALQKFSSKSAWVRNGNVYVKVGENIHRLSCESDLNLLGERK